MIKVCGNQVFKKIFYELGRRINFSLPRDEWEKVDREYAEEFEEVKMELFISSSIKSANKLKDELKVGYESAMQSYKTYLDKSMESAKQMYDMKNQFDLFKLEDFIEKEQARVKVMYQHIYDIPQVKSIDVKNECITVNTHNIYAQDSRTKKWHDIGTFQINIGMMSHLYDTTNTVRIFNTKHKVNAFDSSMQAPHIFGDGHLCHGNLAFQITNAYSRKDIFAVVQLLIIFLQEANVDDPAGKYIDRWPEVTEEIAVPKTVEDIKKDPFDMMLAQAIPVTIK